jgi:hypothetical protein
VAPHPRLFIQPLNLDEGDKRRSQEESPHKRSLVQVAVGLWSVAKT